MKKKEPSPLLQHREKNGQKIVINKYARKTNEDVLGECSEFFVMICLLVNIIIVLMPSQVAFKKNS